MNLTPTQVKLKNEATAAIERFIAADIRPTVKTACCLSVIEEAAQDSRKSSLGGIPSGHLYAAVSGLLSLDEYQSVVSLLQSERKIKLSNHLITWIAS